MSKVKVMYNRASSKLLKAIREEVRLIEKSPWKYGIVGADSLRERILEFMQESDEWRGQTKRVFLHAFRHESTDYEFLVVNHVQNPGSEHLNLCPIISVVIKIED